MISGVEKGMEQRKRKRGFWFLLIVVVLGGDGGCRSESFVRDMS